MHRGWSPGASLQAGSLGGLQATSHSAREDTGRQSEASVSGEFRFLGSWPVSV